MKSDVLNSLDILLKSHDLNFAYLDIDSGSIRILVHPRDKENFGLTLKGVGWKLQKDKSNDIYLYGMDHFQYYTKDGYRLTVCFQMACRSTLNGEWVPLDRKINNAVFNGIEENEDPKYSPSPNPDDLLCYLLAKCVYTEKEFNQTDRQRIQQCLKGATGDLIPKLTGVFFCFTSRMLQMIKDQDYDHIIEELYAFAEYEVLT